MERDTETRDGEKDGESRHFYVAIRDKSGSYRDKMKFYPANQRQWVPQDSFGCLDSQEPFVVSVRPSAGYMIVKITDSRSECLPNCYDSTLSLIYHLPISDLSVLDTLLCAVWG